MLASPQSKNGIFYLIGRVREREQKFIDQLEFEYPYQRLD